MCRNILIGLILVSIVLLTLGVAAFQYFGWLGFLGYLVTLGVCLVLLKEMLPRILFYFFKKRMRKLGKGLDRAVVTQVSITPAPTPPDADDDIDEDEYDEPVDDPWSWIWVDLTLDPRLNSEPWDPEDLVLVGKEKSGGEPPPPWVEEDVTTSDLEIWNAKRKRFVPLEVDSVTGSQRLRFLVGIRNDSKAQVLSLLYFNTIEIAEIPLPRLRIQAEP